MNDYVIVYKHFNFTTQLPPAPVYTFKKRNYWKAVLFLIKILW